MYEKIIVPTDGSEFAMKGLKEGLELARRLKVPVTAIHVIDIGDIGVAVDFTSHFERAAEKIMKDVGELADEMGVELEKEISKGAPYKKITEYAGESDIIYMSSHGHSGFRDLFLGSTTDRVLKHADCTVAVVKQED